VTRTSPEAADAAARRAGAARAARRRANAPETLLLIGTPGDDGVVHVRVWSASDWSAPPRSRAERATALLQWIEEQSAAGRSINQSLYACALAAREGTPHA
jgi:hypothetical protein